MKKISICYTPTGNHIRTMFFENNLSHHNALSISNWKKASDHIEVLGGPKIDIPQFFDRDILDELVTTLSNHFNCEVDYNNTSVINDRTDRPH